jgi:8-oxo-dGTP diphosphatase
VLCNIADRGWCVPSGRVEPGEASDEAARREALEEAGVTLDRLQYIGCYKIDERGESRWADCFTAAVGEMVEIGLPEESLGRQAMDLAEVPAIYHLWNDLTAKVFEHARAVQSRSDSR